MRLAQEADVRRELSDLSSQPYWRRIECMWLDNSAGVAEPTLRCGPTIFRNIYVPIRATAVDIFESEIGTKAMTSHGVVNQTE
jgi:hypothetical protein